MKKSFDQIDPVLLTEIVEQSILLRDVLPPYEIEAMYHSDQFSLSDNSKRHCEFRRAVYHGLLEPVSIFKRNAKIATRYKLTKAGSAFVLSLISL